MKLYFYQKNEIKSAPLTDCEANSVVFLNDD